MGRRQAGDLGDQGAPIRLIGPFQSEILAPVQEYVGGRLDAEQVTESMELLGILLVEEEGLQVQPVEQDQAPEAVGPLDGLRVSAEPVR